MFVLMFFVFKFIEYSIVLSLGIKVGVFLLLLIDYIGYG